VVKEMNRLECLLTFPIYQKRAFGCIGVYFGSGHCIPFKCPKALCAQEEPHRQTDNGRKDNGGVIGINLYPEFLNNSKEATIKDIINHIEYIASLAGPDHIGLGADFDGVDGLPAGINGVQDIEKIFNELAN